MPLPVRRIGFAVMLGALLAGSFSARADSWSVTGSSGSLSAAADFELVGSTLTITLTNTSAADVTTPSQVLTGLFFDSTATLTPVSAALGTGSKLVYGTTSDVGKGWQYKGGLGTAAQGKNAGLSATGLGVFGPKGNFAADPVKLDGLDYGILSAGDDTGTGNKGVKKHGPLIQNSIVFTLSVDGSFSLAALSGNGTANVVFQYGTALDEPHFTGAGAYKPTGVTSPPGGVAPEASSIILLAFGGLPLLAAARRRSL